MTVTLEGYDWEEAFKTSCTQSPKKANPISEVSDIGFYLTDVESVYKSVEGENDGAEWVAVGQLRDGRFFTVHAWCDYTGWD